MPILDLQKRARELGRIRTGDKGDRGQPQKLEKFRLTSASEALLQKVAQLYGGTVRRWDGGGTPQYEVYTTSARLPILVPPQPVDQWLETWSAGGCQHRCDGEDDLISGQPCDKESPLHVNAVPTTRLKVVLRDVEGLGVWRLESHGWNAAMELPEVAQFLAQGGGYVDGYLALEQRTVKRPGPDGAPQTRRFLVPIIEVDVTPAQLLAGEGRIAAPGIEGPVVPALGPGASLYLELLEAATTPDEINAVWFQAKEAGDMTKPLADAIAVAAARVTSSATDAPELEAQPQAPPTDEVQAPADVDAAYQACVALAGELGMNLWAMESAFEQEAGMPMGDASASQLLGFAQHLTTMKEQ